MNKCKYCQAELKYNSILKLHYCDKCNKVEYPEHLKTPDEMLKYAMDQIPINSNLSSVNFGFKKDNK